MLPVLQRLGDAYGFYFLVSLEAAALRSLIGPRVFALRTALDKFWSDQDVLHHSWEPEVEVIHSLTVLCILLHI